MSEVDAEALESAMSDVFPNVPPAELHGTLSGLICAGGNPGQGWMDALAMDEVADLDHQSRELLSELLSFVRGQLESAELRFNLLLPDDDSALVQRTSALADWCRGYLYGLALGGISDQDELPPDCSEVITDVIQISRAEFEMGQPDERDEAAFLEVVEYVRVGVLLVFEELRRPGENESIH